MKPIASGICSNENEVRLSSNLKKKNMKKRSMYRLNVNIVDLRQWGKNLETMKKIEKKSQNYVIFANKGLILMAIFIT